MEELNTTWSFIDMMKMMAIGSWRAKSEEMILDNPPKKRGKNGR